MSNLRFDEKPAEGFLPWAEIDTAPAGLQTRLRAISERMGVVPNSMRMYLHRPVIAETILTMTASILNDPSSTIPKKLKVKLGVICSTTNGCAYCTAHQCELLGRPGGMGPEGWGVTENELQALISGADAGADAVERICFEFARTASVSAADVSDDLRQRMTAVLSPEQIVELACVIGYWKFINTVHDCMKLPIEADMVHRGDYLKHRHG